MSQDKEDKTYWVYLVKCSDGSLYCGISTDVQKRVQVHNSGKGAKYTRSRLPVVLVYSEEALGLSYALKREHAIKKLTAAVKRKMASDWLALQFPA